MSISRDRLDAILHAVTLAAVALLLVLAITMCSGCQQAARQRIDGGEKSLEYDPSYTIDVPLDGRPARLPDGTEAPPGSRVRIDGGKRARAIGPSVNVSGKEADAHYDGSPGDIHLNGARATGGTGGIQSHVLGGGGPLNALTLIGALIAAAGVGLCIWGVSRPLLRKPGLCVVGVGGSLIVIGVSLEQAAWIWMLAIPAVAVLIGYFVWQSVARDREQRTLDFVVAAVESAEPAAREAVKTSARSLATKRPEGHMADRVIESIKRKKGL